MSVGAFWHERARTRLRPSNRHARWPSGARGAASVASIGVVEMVLGLLLLLVPGVSGEVVGLFVGADLILGGICMVNIFWTGRAPCAAA